MLTELFFAARDVSFHRAERPVKERGCFLVREPLLIAHVERELFVRRKRAQGGGEVSPQVRCGRRVGHEWLVGCGRENGELRPAPGIAPAIVRDAEDPGEERRPAAKTRETAVSLHERFLRQIVGQSVILVRQVPQKTANRGVVAAHEFAKRRVIIAGDRAGDKLRSGITRPVAADCPACG
jgi:hypothetical protein